MNFRRPKNFVVVFNLYRAEAIVIFLSLMHKLHEATEGVKPNKQILLSHLEELTVLCILVKHLAMICSSQSQFVNVLTFPLCPSSRHLCPCA